jgi:hypothetical protein
MDSYTHAGAPSEQPWTGSGDLPDETVVAGGVAAVKLKRISITSWSQSDKADKVHKARGNLINHCEVGQSVMAEVVKVKKDISF